MPTPIRANANTVINENAPTDARALLAYYNLEQYPDTHLFYGPMFTDMYAGQDENTPYVDSKPKYEKDEKNKERMRVWMLVFFGIFAFLTILPILARLM